MKNIVISTGGSGGHVLPALALTDHLKENFKVFLVSDKRGSKFLENNKNFEIIDVPNIFSNLLMMPVNILFFILSIFKSFKFLKKNKINILFSTGGYMSLPLCIASKVLNIDIYLFEPNALIGRSNKFLLKYSKKIICNHTEVIGLPKEYKNKIFLIQPLLRKKIYQIEKNKKFKLDEPIKIIILGGSQGAKFFDDKIIDVFVQLSKFYKISLYQQVFDKKKENEIKKIYETNKIEYNLFTFNETLYEKLNLFDLAITRAGASAISELAYFNIPFIAVPFPFAKDRHQLYNAKYYEKNNCCWIVEQEKFEVQKFVEFLNNLIKDESDFLEKKQNLNKISYQNSWNVINQKLMSLINEN